jgi:hypothetical protein
MKDVLALLARLQFKNDKGLLIYASVLTIGVLTLIGFGKVTWQVGFGGLVLVLSLPGLFGKKGDDSNDDDPPPPAPRSGVHRSPVEENMHDKPTEPAFPVGVPTEPPNAARAWIPALVVGLLACGPVTKAAASEVEAEYRDQQRACIRQYKPDESKIIACRKKVAEDYGLVYVPTLQDAGTDGGE